MVRAESPDAYIVARGVYRGKPIVCIVVPGRPPANFRMPAVHIARGLQGAGTKVLSGVPALDWCYGCSATSAAMMVGYYDRSGYATMYTGPTNGGLFPLNNDAWGAGECPLSATRQGYDGRSSRGHVDDYWIAYGNADPDPYITNGWTQHTHADCTGDFMGTNQSAFGNSDGATTFWFYTDGSPLEDCTYGEPTSRDGCHGMKLFANSRGYDVLSNFTQTIQGYNGNTQGFTFGQFEAEVDAERPVMIQVSGHSMVGFGYDTATNTVYIHDTWDHSDHQMTWGGSYAGLAQYAVTVLRLVEMRLLSGPSGTPNPVASGGTVQCSVSVQDLHEHAFNYQWTAVDGGGNAAGSFDNPTAAAPHWTAPSNLTDSPIDYTITATATCTVGNTISGQYSQRVNPVDDVVTITTPPSGTPNPVQAGSPVNLSVAASDSRNHGLTYRWTAKDSGGNAAGSFDDATKRNAVWTAPAGVDVITDYTVAVTVTCAKGQTATASFQQRVNPVADVVSILAGPSGTPNPCASGGTVNCSVTAADSRAHGLTYQWTAKDAGGNSVGGFDDPTKRNPVWTAPQNRTDNTVTYTLAVTITCTGGKTASGSFAEQVNPVADAVTITAGPSGTPNPCASAGTVNCTVTASDSRNHALTYRWTAKDTGGNPAGSFDDATKQNPTWTAPPNLTGSRLYYTIQVAVTCAQGMSDTKTYTQGVDTVPDTVTITAGPTSDANPAASGGTVHCTVTAADSRNHTLTYQWTAKDAGGNAAGSFDDAAKQNPTWTAPQNLTDNAVPHTLSVTATCSSGKTANGSFVQQVNPVPDVVTITAGPTGDVNPAASSGTVHCTVTASDSRNHALTYQWTARDTGGNAVGGFDDATKRNPVWTAPGNYTGARQDYTLQVVVTCARGQSDTKSYVQGVNPAPDILTITAGPTPNADPVASGAPVQFTVTASDTYNHGLAYRWTAQDSDYKPAGSFDDATKANPIWTAPENHTDSRKNYVVTVKVTCTGGQTANAFYVERVDPVPDAVSISAGPSGDPNPVGAGGTVQGALTAADSRNHAITYRWTARDAGGNLVGGFDDPTKANPQWTAPENLTDDVAEYTLAVTATCAQGQTASGSFKQRVNPVPDAVTITGGPAGDVNPVPSGGTVHCSVTGADSRNHVISYQWTARDAGGNTVAGFDDPTKPNPVWTAPENRTDANKEFTIQVTVTCTGGQSDTKSYQQLVLPVDDAVTITAGPSGDVGTAAAGAKVKCSVTAGDSRNHGLTYQWTATDAGGNAVGGFDDATKADPTWTAPMNRAGATEDCTIRVTVTCAGGNDVAGAFVVHVNQVGDLDGDGQVTALDLGVFMGAWRHCHAGGTDWDRHGDLDNDGDVDSDDAKALVEALIGRL
jgi:hypothetical protein